MLVRYQGLVLTTKLPYSFIITVLLQGHVIIERVTYIIKFAYFYEHVTYIYSSIEYGKSHLNVAYPQEEIAMMMT